jgi:hypothetical protein
MYPPSQTFGGHPANSVFSSIGEKQSKNAGGFLLTGFARMEVLL